VLAGARETGQLSVMHGLSAQDAVTNSGETQSPQPDNQAQPLTPEPQIDADVVEAQAGGGKAKSTPAWISVNGAFQENTNNPVSGAHPKGFSAETVSRVGARENIAYDYNGSTGVTTLQLSYTFSPKELVTSYYAGAKPQDTDAVNKNKTLDEHEGEHRDIAKSFWTQTKIEGYAKAVGLPTTLKVTANPKDKAGAATIKAIAAAETLAFKSYLDQLHAVEQYKPDASYTKAGKSGYTQPPAAVYAAPPGRP
jgi:hypothetical protein